MERGPRTGIGPFLTVWRRLKPWGSGAVSYYEDPLTRPEHPLAEPRTRRTNPNPNLKALEWSEAQGLLGQCGKRSDGSAVGERRTLELLLLNRCHGAPTVRDAVQHVRCSFRCVTRGLNRRSRHVRGFCSRLHQCYRCSGQSSGHRRMHACVCRFHNV